MKKIGFCTTALFCAVVLHAAAPTGLRVGIYSGTGAESSTTLALYQAVAAMGDYPMALTTADIQGNGSGSRLTRANFDVFIIPPGEDGAKCCSDHYTDVDGLGNLHTKQAIEAYVAAGGGLVAEEAGAWFTRDELNLYPGDYQNPLHITASKQTYTIVDPTFGSGQQQVWQSLGGGYFTLPSKGGVTVVAKDSSGNPTIVRLPSGAGRIILTSYILELRGDSLLDWTIWDNWAMGGVHVNSVGVWQMLGQMIGWAYNGVSTPPVINPRPNPTGVPVAVMAQHTSDGGAWSGLLPAVGRGIENSGNVPLAIRFQEVISGDLTLANFKVVVFPGGYAYGYKTGLAGYEANVRNFISSGGSYYGICAGSFYAPGTIQWLSKSYTYPLNIYQGQDIGPINDIIAWPGYTLTPISFSDPVIGTFPSVNVMYYGGGYHTIPTQAQQGAAVYTAGTFLQSSATGKADLVRYTYGKGKVALTTTHLETLAGHSNPAAGGTNWDWLFWDNYDYTMGDPVVNPDNPWAVMRAIFNNWLIPTGSTPSGPLF